MSASLTSYNPPHRDSDFFEPPFLHPSRIRWHPDRIRNYAAPYRLVTMFPVELDESFGVIIARPKPAHSPSGIDLHFPCRSANNSGNCAFSASIFGRSHTRMYGLLGLLSA